MRALVGIAVIAGLLASAPANAKGCLDQATLTAARLNEFSMMMMAVNLRCKAIGADMSEGYEAMREAHRPAFAAADRRLRHHFSDQKQSFDKYETQMGNRYGGGVTNHANCARFEKVARDLAVKPGAAALGRVVFAMVATARIEGTACPAP